MSTTYLSTLAFDDAWLGQLQAAFPDVRVRQVTAHEARDVPEEVWAQVDVLHTHSAIPPPHLAPRLRWVQLDTSGVDHLHGTPAWAAPYEMTSLGGISPTPLAEYVLFMVLGHAHRLSAIREVSRSRTWPSPAERWERFRPATLAGATIGIVGYGRIGRSIGALAHALGMTVLGVTRSGGESPERRVSQFSALAARVATAEPGAAAAIDGMPPLPAQAPATVCGPEGLPGVLARADYLVVVVPLTEATRGMIDASAISAMKPGAVLIDVGRGGVVDEGALLAAVRSGALAGAALDVFETEPLPPESPWWSEPNVVVTPHVAGLAGDYHENVQALLTENLRRFLAGEPLINRVDRAAGY